jgi:hypothetical protein
MRWVMAPHPPQLGICNKILTGLFSLYSDLKKLQFHFQEEVYNMLEAEDVGTRLMD